MPGFKYALVDRDGEVFDEVENNVPNWQPGDELRASGNRRFRVTAVVALERVEEFVDRPLYGLLEAEPL